MTWIVSQTEDGWMVRGLDDLPFRPFLRPRHFMRLSEAIEYGVCMIRANGPGSLILVKAEECKILWSCEKHDYSYRD